MGIESTTSRFYSHTSCRCATTGLNWPFFIKQHLCTGIYLKSEASRGAAARGDCKTDWLWVRSPLEEIKYLLKFIFPVLRSGVEVKRDVEFCHFIITQCLQNSTENGERSVLTLGSLCLPCCLRDTA